MKREKKAKSRKRSAAKMIAEARKSVGKKTAKAIVKAPRVEVMPKVTKEEAEQRTEHIRDLFQQVGRAWWEIGKEVDRAVLDRIPEALGRSFSAWAQELFGEAWLRYRRAFLAVKALKGVPETQLIKISEGNAYEMRRVPEKLRVSPEWVKKAIDMNNFAFKTATDKFIEKKTGIHDPMCKITDALGFNTVPKSLHDIVKEAMQMAADVVNCDMTTKQGRIDAFEALISEAMTTYQGGQDLPAAKPNGPEVTASDDE